MPKQKVAISARRKAPLAKPKLHTCDAPTTKKMKGSKKGKPCKIKLIRKKHCKYHGGTAPFGAESGRGYRVGEKVY